MSGVNLDSLSDEQIDELIVGCRRLRALRDGYLSSPEPAFIHAPDATRHGSNHAMLAGEDTCQAESVETKPDN